METFGYDPSAVGESSSLTGIAFLILAGFVVLFMVWPWFRGWVLHMVSFAILAIIWRNFRIPITVALTKLDDATLGIGDGLLSLIGNLIGLI